MQRSILFPTALLILLVTGCQEQERIGTQEEEEADVPEKVKNSFRSQYPDQKEVEWEKEEKEGLYAVEFEKDGKELELLYDESGERVGSEKEIPVSSLKQAIRDHIEKEYPERSIAEAEKIVRNEKTLYEVELKGGSGELELLFDTEGNLKREEEEEEEEEEEGSD